MARKHGGRKKHGFTHPRAGAAASAPHTRTRASFSLRDEARNTERHHDVFAPNVRLRGKHINFVSAGTLQRDEPRDRPPTPPTPTDEMAEMNIQDPEDSFFVDTTGSGPVETTFAPPQLRVPSPTPSSSSEEEVVVFKGRNPPKHTIPPATDKPRQSSSHQKQESLERVSESTTQHAAVMVVEDPPAAVIDEQALLQPHTAVPDKEDSQTDEEQLDSTFLQKKLGGKAQWDFGTTPWVHRSKPGIGWETPLAEPTKGRRQHFVAKGSQRGEDEAMRDYMDNIREQLQPEAHENKPTFAPRDLSLDDDKDISFRPTSEPFLPQLEHRDGRAGFVRNDEQWDDRLADIVNDDTSDDVVADPERILGERTGPGGVSYLVKYEDYLVHDAKWVPARFLTKPGDLRLIEAFETERDQGVWAQFKFGFSVDENDEDENFSDEFDFSLDDEDDDETSNSLGGEEDEQDDEDSEDDEADLVERRKERMTDEQIARILAKQEELGLGSDDVVLFDDDFDYAAGFEAGASMLRRPKQGNRKKRRDPHYFPDASLMADILEQDPYNGFDIMDTDRPSLRARKKGRKGPLPFELSDEETANNLQQAWEADRTKKRVKKAEREKLRAEGLLGRKNKFKPDLAAKYNDKPFNHSQILEEVRTFHRSEQPSCSMPPMESYQRLFVHRFAKKLNMTSKSRGEGNARFTVISKTKLTPAYDEDLFDAIMGSKSFRYGPRENTKGPKGKGKGKERVKVNAGNPYASTTYKHGEIVGSKAPEIGAGNRGHALLEKMGWSKGMALGAADNKGILQPIAQEMRKGRMGLQ